VRSSALHACRNKNEQSHEQIYDKLMKNIFEVAGGVAWNSGSWTDNKVNERQLVLGWVIVFRWVNHLGM